MDWAKIWNDICNFFKNNAWNFLIFFAVLIFGVIFIKLFLNITRKIMKKTKMEPIAVGFICVILKFVLYLILVLSLLGIIGIEVTGILTALSALLLAIGMALQNNIANAANGIIIVSSKMFKKGDYISVDGKEGSVVGINFLFTTILTPDNKRITIPNSTIVNSSVVDYDASKTRRVDIKFSVAYESDVKEVEKIIQDVMHSNGKIRLDPEPFCRLNALNASSIEFVAKCWCDKEDYWSVYYDVLEGVFNEMKRHNISIPFDQIEIRERKDSPIMPVEGKGLPKRVEKKREEDFEIDLEHMNISEIFTKKRKSRKKKNSKEPENQETNNEENIKNSKIEKTTSNERDQGVINLFDQAEEVKNESSSEKNESEIKKINNDLLDVSVEVKDDEKQVLTKKELKKIMREEKKAEKLKNKKNKK